MKVIYAFKQYHKPHYKPIDANFFKLAKLSVELAKKFYKTEFYCDSSSKILFEENGVAFDEVIVLDKIENYTGSITSMSKIYAMMEQSEPYIILDLDTLIFQKLPEVYTIGFAYPEIVRLHLNTLIDEPRPNAYLDYLDRFYKQPLDNHRHKFPEWFIVHPDSSANNSLVMVRHPFLVTAIYKEILSKFTFKDLDDIGAMFIEQFLLYFYLKNHNIDVGYFADNRVVPTTINYELVMHKFIHMMDYHEDVKLDEKMNYISNLYNIKL